MEELHVGALGAGPLACAPVRGAASRPAAALGFAATYAVVAAPVGDNVVDVIYKFFKINKCFQGGGFALLYFLAAPAIRPGEISLFQWVVGANLVALGQALNVGIYRSIGKVGVYYGYKYGMSVPWCTGFPFNVCCAHPQYLGSALTAYGLVLLAATDAHVLRGWGGLAHVQALQYAYMSFVEHNL